MNKKIFFLLISFFILFLNTKSSLARDITLYKDQNIDKAYFDYGNNVEIEGTVNGDTFVAGTNVKVSGVINGDLFVAGEKVEITGVVNGGLRVAGSDVNLKAQVSGSTVLLANKATIEKESSISKDLLTFTQKLTLDGNIGRDVLLVGDEVTLNGQVTRNFTYYSAKEAKLNSGSAVMGQVSQKEFPSSKDRSDNKPLNSFGDIMFSVLSAIIVVYVLNKIFPGKIKSLATSQESFAKTVVLGAFYLLLIPLVCFVLTITVIGLPLSFILLALYFIAIYLSKVVFAYFIAVKIKQFESETTLKPVFFGLVIIELIKFVPIVGFVFAMIGTLWGFSRIITVSRKTFISK